MRHETSSTVCLAVTFLAALAPGCQTFQHHRPVVILAQDIETKKPIAGVDIRVCPAKGSTGVATGTTGSDGIARLRATPVNAEPISVEAVGGGYLTETTYIPLRTVRTLEPAHLFEHEELRPVSFVVEMYAKPLPTIELVVPAGYRGELKANVHVSPAAAWPAGQRNFRYEVSAAGVAEVSGPEMLGRIAASSFTLKYADGTPLSLAADHSELGYWWLRHDGETDYYFVGTKADYTLKRSADRGEEIMEKNSGGGHGRGRHRSGS
jgi:hypothetical protein